MPIAFQVFVIMKCVLQPMGVAVYENVGRRRGERNLLNRHDITGQVEEKNGSSFGLRPQAVRFTFFPPPDPLCPHVWKITLDERKRRALANRERGFGGKHFAVHHPPLRLFQFYIRGIDRALVKCLRFRFFVHEKNGGVKK